MNPEDRATKPLWSAWRRDGIEAVAPRLILYEVANALHQYRRAGQLSNQAVQTVFAAALEIGITVMDSAEIHQRALELAALYSLPAADDAHYLALAESLGAELWTADQRLAHKVCPALPWVRVVE